MEKVVSQPTISESILVILQKKGKLSQADFDVLKEKYKDNPEGLEKALLQRNLIGEEDIARAYADYFGLPFVSLKDKIISVDVLKRIPEHIASHYSIVPYQSEGRVLKIAVASPWRLAKGRSGIISDLRRRKKIDVRLSITTVADLREAMKGYQQKEDKFKKETVQTKATVKKEIPKISLKGQEIPAGILNKFPFEIAEKYRMVVFQSPTDNQISVAAENPQDPQILEILDFIRKANEIKINLFQTGKDDIDFVLKQYFVKPTVVPPPEPLKKEEKKEIVRPEVQKKALPKAVAPKVVEKVVKKKEAVPEVTLKELKVKEKVTAAELLEEVAPEERDLDRFLATQIASVEQLEEFVKAGFVPKIVAAIIYFAAKREASDIHLEPSEKNFRVRYRIDGVLQDILKMPLALQPPVVSRIKILSKLKIDETRIPQDGRFDVTAAGHAIDLRVATLPTVHGEKVALRLLDKTTGVMSLEALGFMGRGFDILMLNIQKPFGIILSCGPTGSGKTTTLYAILNRLNTPSVNIITLEDPVEYEIVGINQCQIKPKIGFSFAEGLRSVVRQDPNIIMVGEIRDTETAAMATHAALTGHLVLSTLHTNDAASALPRLINMGIEPFLITSSINVIIAQRLVRKLCPACKKEFELPRAVMVKVAKELEKIKISEPLKFYKPVGCDRCNNGYHGRVGIFEVLPMTGKIENLAVSKYPASKIKQAAISEGMITMLQDGILKALKGITSIDEVYRVISD